MRVHGAEYRHKHRVSPPQWKVMWRITACRTAALGGHLDECNPCGYQRISYNSCRDRHCPKCQGPERANWIEQRIARLLPVPYFHVVFTLPKELNQLFLRNMRVLVRILFAAAAATLKELARDEKHLGGEIGVTAVLHTWGQNLQLHPHLHCVVTGGGLSKDRTRWIHGQESYLLPVKVLSPLFRGKFLDALHRAWKAGELELKGSTGDLVDPSTWGVFKNLLYRKSWVVYAKPPFGSAERVLRYLGRYTHRVAISNHRIVSFADGKVTFVVKDYADGGKRKLMTLDAEEFIRRFLLHVLPKGLTRIRHYGLCAGRNVKTKLATARQLLTPGSEAVPSESESPSADQRSWSEKLFDRTGFDVMACPSCKTGRLIRKHKIAPELPCWWRRISARAPPRAS